ncbi:ribonuclease HII [Helicobacter suis]|uniref:ribonuclease HII n=1 Tax=Helicobacter suis TaxID=104628 RepID=UPI0013D3691C|nr:ribonuclease HII [Helicobacter suis]
MILGIDEAGRGCLCGSLFVAGVACTKELAAFFNKQGLKESKQLKREKRFEFAQKIKEHPEILSLVVAKSALEIDHKGLSVCMQEAITQIVLKFPHILHVKLDGNTLFHLQFSHLRCFEPIIKGDCQITQIAMASILAKAAKDKEMLALDKFYPAYGFIRHCGYGTQEHRKAIAHLGYLKEHRKSFKLKPFVDRNQNREDINKDEQPSMPNGGH